MAFDNVNSNSFAPQIIAGSTAVASAQPPPDLLTSILTAPWIWLCIALVIIVYGVSILQKKQKRPEEEPLYGVKVRSNITQKYVKDHANTWGEKVKLRLYRGMIKMGMTIKINVITKMVSDKEEVDHYTIMFRNFGFWNWLKSLLGKYESVMLSPDAFEVNEKNRTLVISPKVHIVRESGIWMQNTQKQKDYIDDVNLSIDLQNTKGFTTDWLRRLAVQSPAHAMTSDVRELDAELKEKERTNRIKQWVKGGS